jgi:hypothetical protein
MSHYIDRNNLTITGYLKIDQVTQLNDHILVSGTAGDVSWAEKSAYIPSTQYDHYVGEVYGGGVVTAVWKEGTTEKLLIAAPQDTSYVLTSEYSEGVFWIPPEISYSLKYTVPWSNVTSARSGASWSANGLANTNLIVSQTGFDTSVSPSVTYINYAYDSSGGFSGAAQHCLNYSNPDIGMGVYTDWYLPSAYELSTLFENIAIVTKVLDQYTQDRGIYLADSNNASFPSGNAAAQIKIPGNRSPLDDVWGGITNGYVGWWTSTEMDATRAYAYVLRGGTDGVDTTFQLVPSDKGLYYLCRPFRIVTI